MSAPQIKVVAISNVFTRLMHFVNQGDIEVGHLHNYDHGTLVSAGSVRVEVLDGEDGNVVSSKDFTAPGYVFINKDKYHRIVALEDNSICVCIHALRTIDQDIIPPETFVEPLESTGQGEIAQAVQDAAQVEWNQLIKV